MSPEPFTADTGEVADKGVVSVLSPGFLSPLLLAL